MNRIVLFILLVGLLWFGGRTAAAREPVLEAAVPLYNGQNLLVVNGHSAPAVTDWNNDGRKDLLVGMQDGGAIRLFLNQGTDLNPVFQGGSLILSSGAPIAATYS